MPLCYLEYGLAGLGISISALIFFVVELHNFGRDMEAMIATKRSLVEGEDGSVTFTVHEPHRGGKIVECAVAYESFGSRYNSTQ